MEQYKAALTPAARRRCRADVTSAVPTAGSCRCSCTLLRPTGVTTYYPPEGGAPVVSDDARLPEPAGAARRRRPPRLRPVRGADARPHDRSVSTRSSRSCRRRRRTCRWTSRRQTCCSAWPRSRLRDQGLQRPVGVYQAISDPWTASRWTRPSRAAARPSTRCSTSRAPSSSAGSTRSPAERYTFKSTVPGTVPAGPGTPAVTGDGTQLDYTAATTAEKFRYKTVLGASTVLSAVSTNPVPSVWQFCTSAKGFCSAAPADKKAVADRLAGASAPTAGEDRPEHAQREPRVLGPPRRHSHHRGRSSSIGAPVRLQR